MRLLDPHNPEMITMTDTETAQPDLAGAKIYAYVVAMEEPGSDRGERWFVVGEHEDEDQNEVWYRKTPDALPRKALIKASTLRDQPTWVRVEA
ncbi:hypothetical protein [Amycolatopsis sp. TNS106]|uniref:hypothetical protein n=1 Tax=Amycolatopsis sp. TNS106 TaxID=2861750 RepID=UPI001C57C55C|nr:hypothetical protein [Amycolatopsis sp. TNS106]QXV57348.1 hypothetical protein CVV72_10210 [Amycolatopsis sp. TNS106]